VAIEGKRIVGLLIHQRLIIFTNRGSTFSPERTRFNVKKL